jgi:hypothetical protein
MPDWMTVGRPPMQPPLRAQAFDPDLPLERGPWFEEDQALLQVE